MKKLIVYFGLLIIFFSFTAVYAALSKGARRAHQGLEGSIVRHTTEPASIADASCRLDGKVVRHRKTYE